MLLSKMFQMDDIEMWEDDDDTEEFSDHMELKERLRRTLYFGKTPKMDRPSLPMTELTVEYFQEAVPRELGRVDMYWASSVSRKASISPCAMMLGMLYIERLRHKNPDYIEQMSSEELFLISMMLASKYLYDEGLTEEVYNDEWAESANLDLEDINQLERDFLMAIDWNLFASEEEFMKVLEAMERQTAFRQGTLRGDMTYSDLCTLMQDTNLTRKNWCLLKDMCKVFAVCSLAYTAGTMTMAGSTVTLKLLKAELQTTRPSKFDFLPISMLRQRFCATPSDLAPHSYLPGIPSENSAHTVLETPHLPSSLTADEVTLKDCQRECRSATKCHKTAPSVSQFLTLTLFKDTLMAFIIGAKKDASQNETESESDETTDLPGSHPEHENLKPSCRCPFCPLNSRRMSRRNKTFHLSKLPGNSRPADTNWNQLNNRLLSNNRLATNFPVTCPTRYNDGSFHGGASGCDHDPDAPRSAPLPCYPDCQLRPAKSCSQDLREGARVTANQYLPITVPLVV